MSNIGKQIEIANWIFRHNFTVEGKTIFEVGTGHKAIVPVGFFLSGANCVITVDLYRRLHYSIMKTSLFYLIKCITFKWCLHFLFFPIENNTIYRGSGKVYFRIPSKNF